MVTSRAGKASLGCLVMLLILSATVYFSINIGEAYWRYYRYTDAMKQEVKFNALQPDSVMLRHLWAQADSLGLPQDAQEISIERDPHAHTIRVSADYTEQIELPLMVKLFSFHPHAEGTY